MKKTLITLLTVVGAASVMAQGTINYNIRVTGVVVGHVYGTAVGENFQKTGNTAAETPAGTQTYLGSFLTGSNFRAELFAVQGSGQAEGGLTSVTGSGTTFRTGATLGGTIATSTLTIPQVNPASTGTFQLRAWDNTTGLYPTWAAAEVAWLNGAIAAGKSALFDVTISAGGIDGPKDMVNFRSFNIYIVPEPSTFVLAGLGAAALLIFRRRK